MKWSYIDGGSEEKRKQIKWTLSIRIKAQIAISESHMQARKNRKSNEMKFHFLLSSHVETNKHKNKNGATSKHKIQTPKSKALQ